MAIEYIRDDPEQIRRYMSAQAMTRLPLPDELALVDFQLRPIEEKILLARSLSPLFEECSRLQDNSETTSALAQAKKALINITKKSPVSLTGYTALACDGLRRPKIRSMFGIRNPHEFDHTDLQLRKLEITDMLADQGTDIDLVVGTFSYVESTICNLNLPLNCGIQVVKKVDRPNRIVINGSNLVGSAKFNICLTDAEDNFSYHVQGSSFDRSRAVLDDNLSIAQTTYPGGKRVLSLSEFGNHKTHSLIASRFVTQSLLVDEKLNPVPVVFNQQTINFLHLNLWMSLRHPDNEKACSELLEIVSNYYDFLPPLLQRIVTLIIRDRECDKPQSKINYIEGQVQSYIKTIKGVIQ